MRTCITNQTTFTIDNPTTQSIIAGTAVQFRLPSWTNSVDTKTTSIGNVTSIALVTTPATLTLVIGMTVVVAGVTINTFIVAYILHTSKHPTM